MSTNNNLTNEIKVSELELVYPCELDVRSYEDVATQSAWLTIEPSPPVIEDDGDFSRARAMRRQNEDGRSMYREMLKVNNEQELFDALNDQNKMYQVPIKWVIEQEHKEIVLS